MRKYRPSNRARLIAIALAAATFGMTSSAAAAGGSPTRHEAGPWSSPRVAYKASNKTYRPLAARETAEFARVEVSPSAATVPGNPLMNGSSSFHPTLR